MGWERARARAKERERREREKREREERERRERERGEHSQAGPCRTVGVRSQHTHNIPSRGAPNSKNIQTEEKRVSRSHTATITKRRRSAGS